MYHIVMLAALVTSHCPQQQTLLGEVADAIDKNYVSRDQAAQISSAVRVWAKGGRYTDACGDWSTFTTRLNQDLDAYDGHFHVERVVEEKAGTDDDWLMAWRAAGTPTNMGVREVKVLEGNVGYLRLVSFYPWDMAKPKLTSAMQLLKDTDGLVLDLRQNGGGDAETANHLVRVFLNDRESVVQSIKSRSSTKPEKLPVREIPEYEGGVVVLLDRRSASASEFVGYSLQAAGRAVVVGSRSAGAATMLGEPIKLPHSFQMFVPDSQPVNSKTKRNWERDGVSPDISGGDDAVYVARRVLAGDLSVEKGAK